MANKVMIVGCYSTDFDTTADCEVDISSLIDVNNPEMYENHIFL